MNIRLNFQNVKVSHSWYEHVHSGLYLTLGRYSGRIRLADVTLFSSADKADRPRMGCQIKLTLNDRQLVILQEIANDMSAAIQKSIQHSKRLLDHHFNRMRRLANKPEITRLSA